MTDQYYLKKALDILYKRQRLILNDINILKAKHTYSSSKEGKERQIEDMLRKRFLTAQVKYVDDDIKELLGIE